MVLNKILRTVPVFMALFNLTSNYQSLLQAQTPSVGSPASRWLFSQWQRRGWQIEDGLPHNYVTALAIDPQGYLLAGTQTGIARFDGLRFTLFPNLQDTWIYSLLQASDGTLWAGSYQNGLYHLANGKVTSFGLAHGFPDKSVYSLVEDKSSNIWLVSEAGLYRITQNQAHLIVRGRNVDGYAWQSVAIDEGAVWFASAEGLFSISSGNVLPIKLNGISGMPVTVYRWKSAHQILLGTTTGLYILRCSSDRWSAEPVAGVKGPVVGIRCIYDGALWIATWGRGLFRISGNKTEQLNTREGLGDDFVRVLMDDREGNVWVGSRGGGLTRFRTTLLKPLGMPEGLGGNCASASVSDGADGMWLGTWRSGLFHWRDNQLQQQPLPESPLGVLITSLAVDNAKRLWVGTMHGLWMVPALGQKVVPMALSGGMGEVSHVLFTKRHHLWMAREGKVTYYPSGDPRTSDPHQVLDSSSVMALYEDKTGSVWIGSAEGLWRVTVDTKSSLLQPVHSAPANVTAISEDSLGRLWVGARGGHLAVYENGQFIRVRHSSLPSADIYGILDDSHGGVWFSTGRGLARGLLTDIDGALHSGNPTVSLSIFGVGDGMRTVECRCARHPQSSRMQNGSLWIPTARGFTEINLSQKYSIDPPAPRIEEASIDSKWRTAEREIHIPAGQHELQLRFTAIRLGFPEGVQFRYRMSAIDPDWVQGENLRLAHYSHLPPGHYQFQVSARDGGGRWSDAVFLGVVQQPRIYQTYWFRLLIMTSVVLLALLAHKLRLRMLRMRYSAVIGERNRIAREFHDTLLTGLSAVSWQIDAALENSISSRKEAALKSAQGMLRYCRDEARRAVQGLREEPEFEPKLSVAIKNTIARMTSESGVNVIFDLDDTLTFSTELNLDLIRICQESVGNAVRHGHATEIYVQLRRIARNLILLVRDNGVGFKVDDRQPKSCGHFGILGMRERTERYKGALAIVSRPGEGTEVVVNIPFPMSHSGNN